MKVVIKGPGTTVDLNKQSFILSGGQGSIYGQGGKAFKIYDDPTKLIPETKINELQKLTSPNIIKPEHLLLDSRNKPIGYSMKLVGNSYTLCQLFPKPFRLRQQLTPEHVIKLVRRMQTTIEDIHQHNILIVDLNEMNFLVKKSFDEVYFIDVDSYQTLSFPANALMETVRDRHATQFSRESDWFSFAVVSYQMFRGIHPYKGKHPTYTSLDERMIHNISIHNKDVTYPRGAVLPIDVVPQVYQEWYRAVLDDGRRLAPPKDLTALIIVATKPHLSTNILSGNLFDIILLDIFTKTERSSVSRKGYINGEVLKIYQSGGKTVCLTTEYIYVELGLEYKVEHGTIVGFTPKQNIPVAVWIDNLTKKINCIQLDNGQTVETIPCGFEAESLFESDGRIYYKFDSYIMQLTYLESSAGEIKLMSHVIANVMANATTVCDGLIIQNILGSYYANIFPADNCTYQIRLAELDKSKVIEAKYDNGILMIVVVRNGKYNRYIYSLDKNNGYKISQTRSVSDISAAGLNFVVLPQGICVANAEDGSIEVFSVEDIFKVKILRDSVTEGLTLLKEGAKIVFNRNEKLYQLKMK